MIQKPISLSLPFDDTKVIQLERLLTSLFTNALQSRSGTYTGNGKSDRILTIGIKGLCVIIMRKAAGSHNVAIALREGNSLTYVSGSGIVSDGIKSWGVNEVTLGGNVSVNQAGIEYIYFVIG